MNNGEQDNYVSLYTGSSILLLELKRKVACSPFLNCKIFVALSVIIGNSKNYVKLYLAKIYSAMNSKWGHAAGGAVG